MRTFTLLTIGLVFFSNLSAQDSQTPDSKIREVTVYLSGAQITRDAKITVKPGKTELVFQGLEEGIYAQSIQVSAPPEILLMRVNHEVNYLKRQEKPPRIKVLEDSLKWVDGQVEVLSAEHKVLDQEKAMILANQNIKGDKQALSVAELEKAANFFRVRLTELQDKIYRNDEKQKELTERKTFIQLQMNELNYKRNQPSNDIVVNLESKAGMANFTIALRYVVTGASWTPGYDLRATDTQSPIRLDYRADVYQSTGIDWKDVKLNLSTGNPMQGGTKPQLSQWDLVVQDPSYYSSMRAATLADKKSEAPAPGAPAMAEGDTRTMTEYRIEFNTNAFTLADYTTVQAGTTTTEFKISVPQDIPSDGQAHQVNVQSHEVPATFQHFAVPKLDPDAFLVALVEDWEKYDLLPGNANIFFEGTYVTQAYLDPAVTEDTLYLSFGRDKKVVVTRDMLKDFNKRKVIGTSRERTFAYEISVRNTKNVPVTVNLEDQVPISQDASIEVKVEELSGGKKDDATGKVTWEMALAPSETKKVKLIFTVKVPKNKYVPGI